MFLSLYSFYVKVLEGEKGKGKLGEYYMKMIEEVNLVELEWMVCGYNII